MSNPYLKAGFIVIAALGIGYLALMTYAVATMSITDLVLCSASQGGIRIPSRLCEYYLKNHRGDKADMEELAIGGLDPILNLDDPKKKYALAAYFIAKGLDVNGVNHYAYGEPGDLTPLHASVLYNDPERAQFLLAHGADASIKSKRHGDVTPLALAKRLQQKRPHEDRSAIIRILSDAKPRATAPAVRP